MFTGFYTLGSGMMTQQNKIDVIANNLANTQTPGYRADGVELSAFEKELLTRMTQEGQKSFGSGAPTATVQEEYQFMDAGVIQNTGRDMDVALDGDGFFNIQSFSDANTTYLTRNGKFDLDADGNLILPGYGYVLDDGGTQISLDNTNFTIGERGTIYDSEGEEVAILGVTVPEEGTALRKQSNGMFTLEENGTAVAAEGYRTVQGSLELSNVDLNQEMSRLIETQRAYQLNSSAMQIVDTLNQKSATQIASV